MKWRVFAPARPLIVAAGFMLASIASAQIVNGQVDTFQDGTLMNWTGGANPSNVATGGPAGSGDRFLLLTSNGGSGSGSRLATYNDNQWAGNYQAAGVTRIQADFNNFGATTLMLRVVIFRFNSPISRYTSANPYVLPPGSGWQHVEFFLDSTNLVLVDGSASFSQAITGVDRFMFRHDDGTPSSTGSPIAGVLGIDNVRAVPEPASIVVLAGGVGVLWRRRKSRIGF